MVKYIFHIADLHIPNTEENRPYMEMLKQALAELLKETKKYNKDEFRIVIAGDIFHNKIKTTNEAKKMFHETLNYLNVIGKTIIIELIPFRQRLILKMYIPISLMLIKC